MQKHGIRKKFVIIFSLITLVVIVMTSIFSIANIRRMAYRDILENIYIISEMKEGQVYAYLEIIEARTADFSSDMFVADSLKTIESIGSQEAAKGLSEHLLNHKMSLDPTIIGIMVTNKEGIVVAATHKDEIGYNESGNDYFNKGKKDVYITELSGHEQYKLSNVFAGIAPIKDRETGEFIGVMIINYNAKKLEDILSGKFRLQKESSNQDSKVSEKIDTYLIDKNKHPIAASRKDIEDPIENIDTLPVRECLVNKKEVVKEYINHFGESVIGSSMCIPAKGWVLLTEISVNKAFFLSDKLILGLFFMIPFILIFIILIIYLITSKIVAPIKKLRQAASSLAKGDLNYHVSVETQDEVGDLAASFNEMAFNLRSDRFALERYSQGLENMVKEKTNDLQSKIDDLKDAKNMILKIANNTEEERKKTLEEKDKIDAILHSIGDGVFVVDKDLKVVVVNEVAAKMSGYKEEEILGAKYSDKLNFVFEDTGKINSQFIDKAIETKLVQKMSNHTVLINKDGSKIQVADSAAPLFDAERNIIGCVVVFRNVTKEREVDRAKTEFVSLASHQLRTPLSAINWYSEMLLEGDAGKLNEDQRKYLEEVYKGNQRMVELVNSLLNVSRLELGTFVVEPEPINIIDLIKSSVSEIKPQVIIKKIKFEERYGDNLPMFNADSKLLRMIFQNLLSNAVKYTPDEGKVVIGIAVVDAEDEFGGKIIAEKSIAVFVSDTGYGITLGQQDKIFSKLFRADNVREKDTEGTGLGLYIVKAIIDLSGGMIWFKSEEDKGTTFFFTLPIGGMKRKEGTKKLN